MKFKINKLKAKSFSEMNLTPALMVNIEKMKVTKPTPIQCEAIPVAALGSDAIAIAQTGSGKTLAFALPVLNKLSSEKDSRALILAPSREMAQQIYNVFLALCADLPVQPCLIIGGSANSKQDSQLKKKPRLIVATPGRMNDHLTTNKLLLQNVEVIVIDEADRMLDMGFSPQIESIRKTIRGKVQTLMFSASFSAKVESIAEKFLNSHDSFIIRAENAETPVTALKQKLIFLQKNQKNDHIIDVLNATKEGVIVFAGNQESCELVGKYLNEYGFKIDYVHGGMSQGHRNRVVREFREGKIRVIVATDLLARGIDIPHVECVINFDLPFSAEDFLHRIGRTARAGKKGLAVTYFTPSDQVSYKKIRPYIQEAQEIKLDPKFKFLERNPRSDFDKAKPSSKPRGRY